MLRNSAWKNLLHCCYPKKTWLVTMINCSKYGLRWLTQDCCLTLRFVMLNLTEFDYKERKKGRRRLFFNHSDDDSSFKKKRKHFQTMTNSIFSRNGYEPCISMLISRRYGIKSVACPRICSAFLLSSSDCIREKKTRIENRSFLENVFWIEKNSCVFHTIVRYPLVIVDEWLLFADANVELTNVFELRRCVEDDEDDDEEEEDDDERWWLWFVANTSVSCWWGATSTSMAKTKEIVHWLVKWSSRLSKIIIGERKK